VLVTFFPTGRGAGGPPAPCRHPVSPFPGISERLTTAAAIPVLIHLSSRALAKWDTPERPCSHRIMDFGPGRLYTISPIFV
jgi:hypothetical protein